MIVQLTGKRAESDVVRRHVSPCSATRLRRFLTFVFEEGVPPWKRAISALLPMPWRRVARVEIGNVLLSEIRYRREHAGARRSDVLSMPSMPAGEDGSPMADQELRRDDHLLFGGPRNECRTLVWVAERVLERRSCRHQAARRSARGHRRRTASVRGHQQSRYTTGRRSFRRRYRWDTLLLLVVRACSVMMTCAGDDLPGWDLWWPQLAACARRTRVLARAARVPS